MDHPFQADYARLWDWEVEGLRAVAEHDAGFPVSIEYKPSEPRSLMVLANVSATLLAIAETGAANLGVTLDFGHVLEADTSPAMAAALVGRRSVLLGLHINDGYGHRDDGLMVGAVHTVQTIELLRQLRRDGFDGAIYFDTFPDVAALDPVAECAANVETIEALLDVLDRLPEAELEDALERQDVVDRPSAGPGCDRWVDLREPRGGLGLRRRQPALRHHGPGAVPAAHGETLIGEAWWWKPGGKGGNQAMAAARHGARVRMVGCLGDDGFGERLRERLTAAGVGPHRRPQGATGLRHERRHPAGGW